MLQRENRGSPGRMNGIWFQLRSVQSPSSSKEARTPGAAWATVAAGTAHYPGPKGKWKCSFSSSSRCHIGLEEEDVKIPVKFLFALCKEGESFHVDEFCPQCLHIVILLVMNLLRYMSHHPTEIWVTGRKVDVTECTLLIAPAPIALSLFLLENPMDSSV